jgi:hypothetical protein
MFSVVTYVCKNCTTAKVNYFYCWFGASGDTGANTFYKAGQYPQLQSEPPVELSKKPAKINLDL